MLSNNRLADAPSLASSVKTQPDLTPSSDTAAIAASGARFREAMQAQQRTADANAASARQISEHDAADARNAAQRDTQARQADRTQQQSLRDQALHTSDMRALAARAASDRAAVSDAAQDADTTRQERLRDANNADMTAAEQAQNQTDAARDARRITTDTTRRADDAKETEKRLQNGIDAQSAAAAPGMPGQANTDAAVQAIAGRSQGNGSSASQDDSAGATGGGKGAAQSAASVSAGGAVGSQAQAQPNGQISAQAPAQANAATNAYGNGADSSASGTTNAAQGGNDGHGNNGEPGGTVTGNAGTGTNAAGILQGSNAGDSNAMHGGGASTDNASTDRAGFGIQSGMKGTAQNSGDMAASAQAGGLPASNAAAAFSARLAAQRAQDASGAASAGTGTDAFGAAKKSATTPSDATMTDASAAFPNDKSTLADTNANSANSTANGGMPDPSLLATGSHHAADNSLSGATPLQAQSDQATTANQNAYANGSIDMPFADPRWADAFSQRVVMMSRGGNGQASLHLNPPNLGPVQVVLNMVGNQAQASFVSQHAHVRDAIAAALPSLKDRFANSGMSLAQASVNETMPASATQSQAGANAADFNASLAAGLHTSADTNSGGQRQNGNPASDALAVSGVRRTPAPGLASGAAANAWRPATRPIDSSTGRLGIDTFA